MIGKLLLAFLLLNFANEISSFPSGAPESVCQDLLPKHGQNQPQPTSSSPFIIRQSAVSYSPGTKIIVEIKSLESSRTFKGFVVQGFDNNQQVIIGSFEPGRGIKTIDKCSAVTHADGRGKRSAKLVWNAPPSGSGSVTFVGTVVEAYSDFYTGILSRQS